MILIGNFLVNKSYIMLVIGIFDAKATANGSFIFVVVANLVIRAVFFFV